MILNLKSSPSPSYRMTGALWILMTRHLLQLLDIRMSKMPGGHCSLATCLPTSPVPRLLLLFVAARSWISTSTSKNSESRCHLFMVIMPKSTSIMLKQPACTFEDPSYDMLPYFLLLPRLTQFRSASHGAYANSPLRHMYLSSCAGEHLET